MVTLPKIMSWDTLTPVGRLVELRQHFSNFHTNLVATKVVWHALTCSFSNPGCLHLGSSSCLGE